MHSDLYDNVCHLILDVVIANDGHISESDLIQEVSGESGYMRSKGAIWVSSQSVNKAICLLIYYGCLDIVDSVVVLA